MEMEPALTQEERHSSLAIKMEKYLSARIDGLRKQNDGDRNAEETAKLRGRIAELKILRDLLITDHAALQDTL